MTLQRLARMAFLGFLPAAPGCATRSIDLVNITEKGTNNRWVYPYFLYDQPTALAFWNTNEMECYRNVPSLQALDARGGSVQLVTVVTGRDRLEIDKWIREKRIRYPVLIDLEGDLASQLGVDRYPTFVFFDPKGKEVERQEDIRLVRKWFDDPRWQVLEADVQPASGRRADGS